MWIELKGEVVSGKGVGKNFVRLEWARKQFIEKIGFEPYPGTLNVKLCEDDKHAIEIIKKMRNEGIAIAPPSPEYCRGTCFYADINEVVHGGLILPDVEEYYSDVIELIAPVKIRDELGLRDGDKVIVKVRLPSKRIKAVIFDLDNTLLNTFELFYLSLTEALSKFCLKGISREALMDKLNIGLSLAEILEHILQINGKYVPIDQIVAEIKSIYRENEDSYIRPISGALETLKKLDEAGVMLAVVTGNTAPREAIEGYLNRFDMRRFISIIISGKDVEKRKPDPEGILKCINHLKLYPKECLVVGDSVADVKAGKSAGAWTAAILTGIGSKESLLKAEPDFIIKNLHELVALVSNA